MRNKQTMIMALAGLVAAGAASVAPGQGERGRGPAEWEGARPPRPMAAERGRRGEGMEGMHTRHGRMLERLVRDDKMADQLDLSEKQLDRIRDALFEIRTREIDLRAELEKAGMQQARLLMADEVNTEALMAAIEETGAVRTEMAKLRMRPLLLMKELLTPEQRERARELVQRDMRKRLAGRDDDDAEGKARRERWRERREARETEDGEDN